jgi:RimJ/RimL family protein N-acetyltransferase
MSALYARLLIVPLSGSTITRITDMWERWATSSFPDDFDGVSIVVLNDREFVRAPERFDVLRREPPTTLDALVTRLGDDAERVVGEAQLSYADAATLQLRVDTATDTIADDDPRLSALEATADRDEWLEASADEPCALRRGIVDRVTLRAVAALQVWDDTIGHFSVFTRAADRGHGLAAQVVSPVIAASLDLGVVPQWRALLRNVASQRVADKLGFVPLGRQMFVRVRLDQG